MQRLTKLFYIMLLVASVMAQDNTIEELKQKYVSFNYDEVVKLADKMISSGNYSSSQLTEIYEMKGMSEYSLGQELEARYSFEELLRLDPNFSMNPNRVSPKIVNFYNEIKVAYLNELEEERPILDSLRIIKQNMAIANENYKTAVIKNIVFPGWGHFQMGNTTKGLIYSILNVASTAASIVYIIETNNKESAYLNETDKNLIASKYSDYNSSYKTRNLLLAATIAIWISSQVDILFFTDIQTMSANGIGSRFSPPSDLQFSFSLPLN